ncbi:MAG: SUMF1/EgtB/PvdO family nonheme iron enzyme [Labilithrix sp.]|nr:SUMF1/EgtB/PvdO family nonheme iron enzyme [Labilithrix sp.]
MAIYASSCGGRVEPAAEGPPPPLPQGLFPEEGEARYPAHFPLRLPVAGGNITFGGPWQYDRALQRLVLPACNGGPSPSARVASFRLMRTEVTNAVYGDCVDAGGCAPPAGNLSHDPVEGAWDAPWKASKPVAVGYLEAERFCTFYGGALPTPGQYIRASTAGEVAYGIPQLTEAFLRCVTGRVDPLCEAFAEAAYGWPAPGPMYRTLPDSGTTAWDEGPYGHRDIFGSAREWERFTDRFDQIPQRCSAGWQEEAIYTGTGLPDDVPLETLQGVQFARALWLTASKVADNWNDEPVPPPIHVYGSIRPDPEDLAHASGFRCAFPP